MGNPDAIAYLREQESFWITSLQKTDSRMLKLVYSFFIWNIGTRIEAHQSVITETQDKPEGQDMEVHHPSGSGRDRGAGEHDVLGTKVRGSCTERIAVDRSVSRPVEVKSQTRTDSVMDDDKYPACESDSQLATRRHAEMNSAGLTHRNPFFVKSN
eukprot:CAMPEP_0184671716 /NCGR_PEP_ID=MMETSP0308-20130426/85667_1 /TAXON_ID=38269 /ORGANISM="Gloeochaete witrockiana, Strain SAG 46.84" /LENGTH=155 /DNA_ID=CAMNT_0027118899 /DNA_START=73 /DNA_END=540 /DNA_ORIENTATION=+